MTAYHRIVLSYIASTKKTSINFGLVGYNAYRSRYERNAIPCENNKRNVKELNNQAKNKTCPRFLFIDGFLIDQFPQTTDYRYIVVDWF